MTGAILLRLFDVGDIRCSVAINTDSCKSRSVCADIGSIDSRILIRSTSVYDSYIFVTRNYPVSPKGRPKYKRGLILIISSNSISKLSCG